MAVKLQSHWRGASARSTVVQLKSEKQAEAEAAAVAARLAAAEADAEAARLAALEESAYQAELENAMAVKLQSHWRGASARSTVVQL
ncbi:P-loop containing nucleoside triphosphate hydrolase, partial [Globisporangium polare]